MQGKTDYDVKCMGCHGATAGGGLGPNITGSMTAGIGAWTEAAFNKAVREAVGKDGEKLCVLMTAFPPGMLSDTQLKNIYAYVLSTKNDTVNRGTGCP